MGPEGLKRAEEELNEAKAEHDKPIPTEILLDFAVPSVKSIAFIPVQSLQEQGTSRAAPVKVSKSESLAEHVQADGSPLPFFVEYDHVDVSNIALGRVDMLTPHNIQSDFVMVQAFFSLEKLPHRLRP